ncbi:GNAT family N-acetyltransferase [Nocardioides cynanchi]|uniref:GNAT family N-acetyltransferase n=1 Tax=Nocardioides cynanchi TaxID=2558918 RepID=UPI001247CAE9|nr:GNAT family N-acetyltransferase [Nocardioides cynanchi]
MTACPTTTAGGLAPAVVRAVEPLAPGDVATVLEVFDQLGPRSREQRFLTAKPRLTAADLRALTDVDDHHHVALVARDRACRPIGVARFVRDPDDPAVAEAAVAVVDAWQGRGVGTGLARALTARARELGVTRVSLTIAHDNEAAVRLMHGVDGVATRVGWDEGTADFEVSFEPSARPVHRRTVSALKGSRP